MQYTLKATIPCGQYANLAPEITLEGKSIPALHKKAMEEVQKIWDEYGTVPLKKNTNKPTTEGVVFEEKLSFTGEKVLWSEYLHEYRSLDQVVLTSGSKYAALTEKPFNSELLSEKSGKAWGVDKDALANLWKMNGKIATDYGTAVHQALETYMVHHELGAKVQEVKGLEYNYALPKNVYLRNAVLSFVEMFGTFDQAEVFVTDVNNRMAGQIDGLNIIDLEKKICNLGDYKTNFEMKKPKLKGYQKQMNFYRTALENKGWTVEKMEVYHYDGEKWHLYPMDREDIDMKLFT